MRKISNSRFILSDKLQMVPGEFNQHKGEEKFYHNKKLIG